MRGARDEGEVAGCVGCVGQLGGRGRVRMGGGWVNESQEGRGPGCGAGRHGGGSTRGGELTQKCTFGKKKIKKERERRGSEGGWGGG